MKLAELIRGASPAPIATLTVATPATLPGNSGPTVATVATVAVANARSDETVTGPSCERAALDPAIEAAYAELARTLAEHPECKRAVRTVEQPESAAYVLLAVAVRDVGYVTLRIPRKRYDGFKVIEMLNRVKETRP